MSSEVNIVVAGSADDWRAWLARNCRSAKEVCGTHQAIAPTP